MLTFYPEFEAESPQEVEVVFLLDLSCSMKVSTIAVVLFSRSETLQKTCAGVSGSTISLRCCIPRLHQPSTL